jgi:hypothetical protein
MCRRGQPGVAPHLRQSVIGTYQRGLHSRRGDAAHPDSYADQNEGDCDAFAAAVKSGRLTARTGPWRGAGYGATDSLTCKEPPRATNG